MSKKTLGQKLRSLVQNQFGADLLEEKIEKALRDARQRSDGNPRSIVFDPMTFFSGREWVVRQGAPLSYHDLRQMSKTPVINAIVQTRLNQLALFTEPQRDYFSPGFRIVSDDLAAKKDLEKIRQLEQYVYNCGILGFGEQTLESFVRKFMRDSLVLDHACAEIVPRYSGKPAYFIPVDGATIRLLRRSVYPTTPDDSVQYVQVINDEIVNTYTENELFVAIRNGVTDLKYNGYGMPELETLIQTVTALVNTERYNASLVAQGGTQKGLLLIKGDGSPEQLESFKRDFREAIRNASRYWRPPVLQVGPDADIRWESIEKNSRDLEFSQLWDFLLKLSCATFNIHPEELSWSVRASGARATFESGNTGRITHSMEKGLRPLLKFLADTLNTHIIQKIDKKYRLTFVGLNVDRERDIKNLANEVTHWKTVNEMRVEMGLKEMPGWDIPLNQNLIFWLNAQTMDDARTDTKLPINPNQFSLDKQQREAERQRVDQPENGPSERVRDEALRGEPGV
jgi:hypothetical protein